MNGLTTPHVLLFTKYPTSLCTQSGPGRVVGIAIGYGLDGPEIESRWGRDGRDGTPR